MRVTKEDLIRYLVIEHGFTSGLAEIMLKREYPEIWQALDSAEGIELDSTHEVVTEIQKWRDWHNNLKEGTG